MSGDIKIADGIFGTDSENYSQRVPCVVVMDCSYSMKGRPIESLNDGLRKFEQELKANEKASNGDNIYVSLNFERNVTQFG